MPAVGLKEYLTPMKRGVGSLSLLRPAAPTWKNPAFGRAMWIPIMCHAENLITRIQSKVCSREIQGKTSSILMRPVSFRPEPNAALGAKILQFPLTRGAGFVPRDAGRRQANGQAQWEDLADALQQVVFDASSWLALTASTDTLLRGLGKRGPRCRPPMKASITIFICWNRYWPRY